MPIAAQRDGTVASFQRSEYRFSLKGDLYGTARHTLGDFRR